MCSNGQGGEMNAVDAVKRCFRGYVDFSGRAPRSEYWWWLAFLCVVMLVLMLTSREFWAGFREGYSEDPATWGSAPESEGGNVRLLLLQLGTFLPTLAVTVRRLHDGNWSGWWATSSALLGLAMLISALFGPYGLGVFLGIPLVGELYLVAMVVGLLVLIRMFVPGTRGENRFGPDPLEWREAEDA